MAKAKKKYIVYDREDFEKAYWREMANVDNVKTLISNNPDSAVIDEVKDYPSGWESLASGVPYHIGLTDTEIDRLGKENTTKNKFGQTIPKKKGKRSKLM